MWWRWVGPHEELEFASLLPNSRAGNLYGLTHKQRAQGPELANLANQARDWVDCAQVDGDCLAHTAALGQPLILDNTSNAPTLCGPVLLVQTVPVPWAYRHDYDGWRLEQRAVLIEARCS